MPPKSFEDLANGAFKVIKKSLGTREGEITYRPKIGGSHLIRGVFDDRAQEVDPDTEQVIDSNIFTLGIQLADLPVAPDKGDKVTIKNQDYSVVRALCDGVPGVSIVLVLHRIDE